MKEKDDRLYNSFGRLCENKITTEKDWQIPIQDKTYFILL